MNIKELNSDKLNYQAQIIVPHSKLEEEVKAQLAEISKTAKIDGFRPGKVPSSVLEKKYGESVRSDVIRTQVEEAIKKIITDNKLDVVTNPEIKDIKNESGKDLEFKLDFELMPEIKMPDLKKIEIEKPVLTVADKDVEERLKKIAEYSKTYEKESKGAAKKEDQVTIDSVGYVDGEAFEGGKLDAHKLVLGSGTFIPGFEDQLIGKKAGEEIDVKVEFPKEYHAKHLAGKPAEFKTKILAVHTASTPKIDDDFAKKFKCDDLADMKNKLKEDIARSYDESIHVAMKMSLFNELEKVIKFEPPKSLINKEIAALEHQKGHLMTDEAMKSMSDKKQKEFLEKMAFRRVAIGLILAEYVKEHKITVVEDDIKQAIFQQARNYPGQEQQIIEFYQKDKNAIENLKGPIMEEKAVKQIFEKEIKTTEKKYSKDKMEKKLQELNEV